MYNLGLGVPQDYTEAIQWYRQAAEQGDAGAQNNLGVMYRYGQGVPQNDAEAVKWFRLAAEQGIAGAQANLGLMYFNGQGIRQNYAEAAKWFRLAAEQGHAVAQVLLGTTYADGQDIPQDKVQTLMWLNLGIAHMPPGTQREGVMKMRDMLVAKMAPTQIAHAQELARNWHPQKEPSRQLRPPPESLESFNMMIWDVHLPKTTEFIQIVLDFLGYNPGPVNGTLGQKTRVAIHAFQQQAGLQDDGEISPALVNRLYTAVLRRTTPPTR